MVLRVIEGEGLQPYDIPIGAGEVFFLPPIFSAFHSSVELRTCSPCGAVHPGRDAAHE